MSACQQTGKSQVYFANNYNQFNELDSQQNVAKNKIFGPWRVKPGGLSVTVANLSDVLGFKNIW